MWICKHCLKDSIDFTLHVVLMCFIVHSSVSFFLKDHWRDYCKLEEYHDLQDHCKDFPKFLSLCWERKHKQ
jgi:hypothetical protein